MKTTRRIREPKVRRLAKAIDMPQSQIDRGDYEACDVANRTDADQRHSVRSEQTRTVRRTTKIQQLVKRGLLNRNEGKVCEWYLHQHTAGYETAYPSANWNGNGGATGWRVFSLSPKYYEQEIARRSFDAARASINPSIVGLFDQVVLHDGPLGRRSLAFKVAVEQLDRHLAEMGIAV